MKYHQIRNSKFEIRNSPKGQGLLEAVVALGIIITGAVAALTLGVASLSAGVVSESRIIAANLAREGIEIVRNTRDSNWVAGKSWDTGLATGTYTLLWDNFTKRMQLSRVSEAFVPGERFRVHRIAGSAMMTAEAKSDTTPTIFFRGVTLSDLCKEGSSPCERIGVRVRSHVGWERQGKPPTKPQFEVIADLYAWR